MASNSEASRILALFLRTGVVRASEVSKAQQQLQEQEAGLDEVERALRFDLSIAHKLTHHFKLDELVWNHISSRRAADTDSYLITPGKKLFHRIQPDDLVISGLLRTRPRT